MKFNGDTFNYPEVINTETLPDIKEIFEQGSFLYRRKDLDKAINVFRGISEINPEILEAKINLGNAYFKKGNIAEAKECWKSVLEIEPNNFTCYQNIGNALYKEGKFDEAATCWYRAISIKPDYSNALFNLGAYYEKKGSPVYAFRFYEKFMKYAADASYSEYTQVINKINQSKKLSFQYLKNALILQRAGKLKKALLSYLSAVKIYPNLEKAHLNIGSICFKAEKYEQAVNAWVMAYKINDSLEDFVCCNLGIAYEKLKQYSYAYCAYSRYIKSTNQENYTFVQIQDRMKKIQVYLEKHSEQIKQHLDKAEVYSKNKRYMEALYEYENYAILKPEQAETVMNKIKEVRNIFEPEKKLYKT